MNEKYLKKIVTLMPGHVYWKDKKGAFLGCNLQQAVSAGFNSPEDLIGKTDYEMPWSKQAGQLRAIDKKVMELDTPMETEEISHIPGAQQRTFLSKKIPLHDSNGKVSGILGISFDITERKQSEQSIFDSKTYLEKTFQNILDYVPAHVYWKDKNCILLGCNKLQAERMGFNSPEEMKGKSNYDLIVKNQPEKERKRQADSITKADLEVMNSKKEVTVEEPLILPDGTKLIYLSKKVPMFNDSGEVIGILGVSLDITEKVETEKELTETRHKLDGMALISASIAHELRTPLQSLALGVGSIRNFFPKLLKAYHAAEENELVSDKIQPATLNLMDNLLNSMDKEINMSSMAIDLLLMNMRTEVQDKQNLEESFSIKTCVEEALERYPFKGSQREKIEWTNQGDFSARGNQLLLTHVLFNLIKNAIYHLAKAGKGNISIYLEEKPDFNCILFKDTGTGISEKDLPHIFKRFVSKTHHGAGVGLAFCKMVMESMNGQIFCESVEGEYTLFKLIFPKHKK